MAQGAASAAVALKSRNKDFKQVAGSSAFSALVAGITEPALYGVTLRLKRPMLGACIGAMAGGLFGGFFQMKCFGIATPAIVTIVQYVEESRPMSLMIAALTILLTVVVTFIATLLIGFEDVADEEEDGDDNLMPVPAGTSSSDASQTLADITVPSPLEGRCIPISQVKDATFAKEILGKGAAILPEGNTILSPFDGTVAVMFETGHAVGLISRDGVELLIHVGIDTVNLGGQFFHPVKRTGDSVRRGEVLLTFDREEIQKAGYDITTPVIVSNTGDYSDVVPVRSGRVQPLEPLLNIR